jgi:transaldolase/glucose-6-phosphate isomerase
MENRVRQIAELGQAIWLDYISRDLLRTGRLRRLIDQGVAGVTSNPTIFQQAVAAGTDYDRQIRALAREGHSAADIYEALAAEDIAAAADALRPLYNETHGRDGFVSLEVNPQLAHDTEGTIAEARRLYTRLGRPNVMIKVPATPEGLPAVASLIGDGINVNVTLIFGIPMYENVMRAYVDGLATLRKQGRPLGLVSSVASFFVSRLDTLVDKLLRQRLDAGEKGLDTLFGQAAIANAKIAYDHFRRAFQSSEFRALKANGARMQRPLWASTSTKNPAYSPTKYVDNLIGPHTVNTVPPQTLDAIHTHATVARTVDLDVDQAHEVMRRLAEAKIDFAAVTEQLMHEGVKSFAASFAGLMADIEAKRVQFLSGQPAPPKT